MTGDLSGRLSVSHPTWQAGRSSIKTNCLYSLPVQRNLCVYLVFTHGLSMHIDK